jgi:hypothetical protein
MARLLVCAAGSILLCAGYAAAQTTVYNSLPIPQPPNVPSQGFQCCATAEFGDQIQLAGSSRVFSVTQTFLIPWRPEADPTCPYGGTAWRSPVDNSCYNGLAFTITFDLRHAGPAGASVTLPGALIFGIAYNTNTWGYNPLHLSGPYESLNVGLNNLTLPSVGTDVDSDAVFWNTAIGGFYTDGGAAGISIFRKDTGRAPYVPAVQFYAFSFATSADSCKDGGWQNLVRTDFTSFKNQGDCVSYTHTGK